MIANQNNNKKKHSILMMVIAILFVSQFYAMASSEVPCFRKKQEGVYTCRQLGMIPNDYKSRDINTLILVGAINSGKKIKCDNTYYLSGNDGDIEGSIYVFGKGGFIITGTLKVVNNISDIYLEGISFKSYNTYVNKACDSHSFLSVFLFPPTAEPLDMNQIIVKDCYIDNVNLIRFQNRRGDRIKRVTIDGSTWKNIEYIGVAIGSTIIEELQIIKNKAYRVRSRLFDFATASSDAVKIASIKDNYLSNKGYFSTTTEFYAGLIVLECDTAICEGNTVEDFVVANPNVNLYDVYCNCKYLIYRNNIKHNVINLQDVNMLCKAKSFRGEHGSRIVEDNSFIVDDKLLKEHQLDISSGCSIQLMTLSPNDLQQDLLIIKNNVIRASVPCSFGMSGATKFKSAYILDNVINCQSVAGGNYFFKGSIDTAFISNNKMVSRDKIKSNTPAISLSRGCVVLDNCQMSAFLGSVSSMVESIVKNSTLTFPYNEKASPNISLGGEVENCMVDFQRYDLAENYNVYLSRAHNMLNISNLIVTNVPGRGTLWLRYILDTTRASEYVLLTLMYKELSFDILIDNINHELFVDGIRYTISNTKKTIAVRNNNADYGILSFYGDRIGLPPLIEEMKVSVIGLTEPQFLEYKENNSQ